MIKLILNCFKWLTVLISVCMIETMQLLFVAVKVNSIYRHTFFPV